MNPSFSFWNISLNSALFLAAKYHCLPQPGGPQWVALPAGRHGGSSVHAAPGEGGANGRHRGSEGPACRASGRGAHLSSPPCLLISVCLHSVYPPDCPLAFLPFASLAVSVIHYLACWFLFFLFWVLFQLFIYPDFVTIDSLMVLAVWAANGYAISWVYGRWGKK